MWRLATGLRGLRAVPNNRPGHAASAARCISNSSRDPERQLLSNIWIPSAEKASASKNAESVHDMLIRAGFLRQSRSGIFHLLPLGLMVQDKIEKIVDKHIRSLGASRLSMSTLTTEELWQKSGRLESVGSELFRLKDRKDTPLMLAPTHEEEVTTLVADSVKSYKELPIKLYQITRKYRDELRPRQGLLRGREFVMMDLYSFDTTYEKSFETYQQVTEAYRAIFKELGLGVTMAEASSGDMGGDLSHEWHVDLASGSDTIFTCKHGLPQPSSSSPGCGYAANDEVVTTRPRSESKLDGWSESDTLEWRGITKDKKTLIRAWIPKGRHSQSADIVSMHAVKTLIPDLDTSVDGLAWQSGQQSIADATHLVDIIDSKLSAQHEAKLLPADIYNPKVGDTELSSSILDLSKHRNVPDIERISAGDDCPICADGELQPARSMEMGHTFYLGTRYTEPLNAKATFPDNKVAPLHMGCYGIGVSRLLGTIAELRAEKHHEGMPWSWPVAIAPFQVTIIPVGREVTEDVLEFYDTIRHELSGSVDVVLDDRQRSFGWKTKDAQLFGIPITIILGKGWKDKGEIELTSRRQTTVDCQQVSLEGASDAIRQTLLELEAMDQKV